jgi:hypothetical protein
VSPDEDFNKAEILGATAIDSIQLVFVSKDYSSSALTNNSSDSSIPTDVSGDDI